jgi:iron complex outermembrane receptor protein
LDINMSRGFYLFTTVNNTSKLPLNDANDEFAKAYTLLQAKIGWKKQLGSSSGIELFAGADNLLNEQYSLGNDINAFGKRYYNPSPINNYFGGLIVSF